MMNMIMARPGEATYITWAKKRIENNLNLIGFFQGPTGSGKTWSAIAYAEDIDPTFESRQIVFDFQGLMNVINADWFKEKEWRIIILDEPQVTMSNRAWQSLTNRLMNYLLSTFRHQNIILLLCAPYTDFLDNQSMKLLHVVFECKGVKQESNMSILRPRIQQYNPHKKRMYPHQLYVLHPDGSYPMDLWEIERPSMHLIQEYEQMKQDFTYKLNKSIEDQLLAMSKPQKDEEDNPEKPVEELKSDYEGKGVLTPQMQEILVFWKQGVFTPTEIGRATNQDISEISKRFARMRKKGYFIEYYRDLWGQKASPGAILLPIPPLGRGNLFQKTPGKEQQDIKGSEL